jgi:hypothetical protein
MGRGGFVKLPDEPSNADLARVLGRIEANQANALREADKASESRRILHDKLEETNSVVQTIASQLGEHAFQLRATTDIAIQARDGLNAFRAKFEKEAAPILDGVGTFRAEVEPLLRATRTVRNWSAIFAVIAGSGVVSLGAVLAFFNEAVKSWFKHWLGI